MLTRVAIALLVPIAHVASVPVYMVYEVLIRALNRRRRPLSRDELAAVGPYFSDVDLKRVEISAPAWIPTGHSGLTLGHRMFLAADVDVTSVDDVGLLVHELVHVRQRERWGRWAMMRRYGVEWARRLSYDRHPLEIEAYAAQRRVLEQLSSGS